MDVDRAVIERLAHHRHVGRHHATRNETEGWTRVLVKAGQINRAGYCVGRRINDAEGVGVLVANEDAVSARSRLSLRAGGWQCGKDGRGRDPRQKGTPIRRLISYHRISSNFHLVKRYNCPTDRAIQELSHSHCILHQAPRPRTRWHERL